MEHHINIEERLVATGLDRSTTTANVLESIDKKIRCLPHSIMEPCIFRVHEGLRKSNEEAYTPMLVSIGPYHHGKLGAMEEHKLRYLHSVLERREERSVERCMLAIEILGDRARKCYAGHIDLERDKFLEMLLLDGCFVVEFLRRASGIEPSVKDDPIFSVPWMAVQIRRDMMLLENQLPYFVISELYDLINEDREHRGSFMTMAMRFFSSMFPKLCQLSEFSRGNKAHEIKHLLHLVHIVCRPLSEHTSMEGNTKHGSETVDQMRSVIELHEAGVKFKKVGKIYASVNSLDLDSLSDSVSLFDIKFNKGSIEIPSFKVEDSTETFFRNLIAFEQHFPHIGVRYFTDYTVFMDQLINTENDVNYLRQNGFIVNLLGEDKKVASIFNKLGEWVVTSPSFYYSGVCLSVNKHCEKKCIEVMTKLRRDYFNTPWASVSTVAAGVLLLLTLIQTVASLISLFN